ncbi:hypothetical protein J4446_00375 [Candidatus Woesearchaeota archaeon]|nr:hypothetical protein [Candidatus Woesearchaeota archaeon]
MKRAQVSPQAGSNVAVFIFLLALFLALYILLIPPEDREKLLQENLTKNGVNAEETERVNILEQSPGQLKISNEDAIIHKIDSINLYSKEEPKVTDLASSLYLEKSLFSETERNLMFDTKDLENLDKLNLVLIANEGKGNLIIELNEIIIYDTKTYGLTNIVLPKDLLQETNKLKFSVSSPGVNLFGKNSYALSGIKIRENYELTNTRESRDFILSDQETGNAELRFFLYCNDPETGARLRIFINNEEIKNEVISCTTAERRMDIKNEDFVTGVNTLMFQIDKGDFVFSDLKVEIKTDYEGSVNYKFSITEDEFDDILSEDREAILLMEFNDDNKKEATISVNGKEFSLDTEDIDYERDISRLVKEGNNFIKIIPLKEFNIDLLKITLE